MLQKLNERIQGVVAWIVIILIAMTFTLFGVDYYMQSHQSSSAEVEVNGQPISKQAFDTNYRRSRQQRDPSTITAASDLALKKQVLDDMINNEVTVQAAKNNGFTVGTEQADAAILQIPQFQEDGHFSAERYKQTLSGAMFTPQTFQTEVKQGMLMNQQRFAFIGSAFALPAEIERFVKLYKQTRDYDYLEIPTALFVKESKISDEVIKSYYQSHQQEFLAPEMVSVSFVRLSMQAIKDNIQVSDEQIKRYYDENQSNYLTPAQWQVAHILYALPENASIATEEAVKQKAEKDYAQLQANPSQFNELVKTNSDDKLSIANDGILPWINAGQTDFDKVLMSLTKPGQLSAPIKAKNGYELFKLVAYKPAILKPLSEVRDEIKEQLLTELAQVQYAQALEQLGDLSYQTPDTLEPVAQSLKLKIEQTKPFSRQGGDSEFTKNTPLVNTAFSHDVLELGNNSEPVQFDNDSVVVLRVNEHLAAAEKPLDEVKAYINSKLSLQEAEKQAKKLGDELLAIKETPVEEEKLIQSKQLKWHAIEEAARDSDKASSIINDLAFSLPKVNSRDGRSLENGNYVIVRLKKINEGQLDSLDKEQQASLAQQIETNYGVMDYDLYINELVNHAKIVKN